MGRVMEHVESRIAARLFHLGERDRLRIDRRCRCDSSTDGREKVRMDRTLVFAPADWGRKRRIPRKTTDQDIRSVL